MGLLLIGILLGLIPWGLMTALSFERLALKLIGVYLQLVGLVLVLYLKITG